MVSGNLKSADSYPAVADFADLADSMIMGKPGDLLFYYTKGADSDGLILKGEVEHLLARHLSVDDLNELVRNLPGRQDGDRWNDYSALLTTVVALLPIARGTQ